MPALIDITGHHYGRLTVINISHHDRRGHILWACRCDCGTKAIVRRGDLQQGRTRSCGCLKRDITRSQSTKHGHAPREGRSGAYRSWAAMRQRCRVNHNYSERGIKVCKRWLSFERFFTDMGSRPRGLTLDRINNDGDYKPGNCHWVTRAEQARNQRRTKLSAAKAHMIRSDTRSLSKTAQDYGVSKSHISAIKHRKVWR
jgi:hypothetical protein